MATFECKVYKLKIEEHPNADALELAVVGDYRSIVRKGQFKTGDYGVYIPEAAVLPDWLIEKLGLVGKLAGKQKNRVKAIKLRSVLSQGLIYPVLYNDDLGKLYIELDPEMIGGNPIRYVAEGLDVQDDLEVTKYEPPIPTHMAGEVYNAHGYTLGYDIENIKKYPDVFNENDLVYVTEKLHGTWCCFGWHPDAPALIVTSKGLSGRGLAFKHNEANENNLYIRAYHHSHIGGVSVLDRIRELLVPGLPVYLLGEVFGPGVQDLHYGLSGVDFRAFDIYVGTPGQGRYLSGNEFMEVCRSAAVQTVPVLGIGAYDRDEILSLTDGKDNITQSHIREGIVIRELVDTGKGPHPEIGRRILKSVSEAYLLRGGDVTEFN